jgi:hypothetical protein
MARVIRIGSWVARKDGRLFKNKQRRAEVEKFSKVNIATKDKYNCSTQTAVKVAKLKDCEGWVEVSKLYVEDYANLNLLEESTDA